MFESRCTEFTANPYATVLIPEPADYFQACSSTSLCELKCRAEFEAFDKQLAMDFSAMQEEPPKTIEKTVESMFFMDLNEDAFMPLNVLAMVELSDCRFTCGGVNEEDMELGGQYEFGTSTAEEDIQSKEAEKKRENSDTCIAVAGLAGNNTVSVRKYCIPKAQGQGVRSAASETWYIWYSEEWTSTLVSLHFADTVTGDTLVALRDNRGRSLETGHVLEDIVSVHPRTVQIDERFYDRFYGDKMQRLPRFALTYTSKMDVVGFSKASHQVLKITDVYVLPAGSTDARRPWIFMSYIAAALRAEETIQDSQRYDVCQVLDVEYFISSLGKQEQAPQLCNLQGFFDKMRLSAMVPVVMPTVSFYVARILLMPSSRQALVDACIISLHFESTDVISGEQTRICFNTPEEFLTGASFPTRPGWMDLQRSMFLGVNELTGSTPSSMTQEGNFINSMRRRIVSQNSLSLIVDMDAMQSQKVRASFS